MRNSPINSRAHALTLAAFQGRLQGVNTLEQLVQFLEQFNEYAVDKQREAYERFTLLVSPLCRNWTRKQSEAVKSFIMAVSANYPSRIQTVEHLRRNYGYIVPHPNMEACLDTVFGRSQPKSAASSSSFTRF